MNKAQLQANQLEKLQAMLGNILPGNVFYAEKLKEAGVSPQVASLDWFYQNCPFTLKSEIVEDQIAHPPYGRNLTFPIEKYVRFNQTSGTTGRPMRWLDTAESWDEMLNCWAKIFLKSGVNSGDRIFFAFSFGPFLGFWTAFGAATRIGCLAIPGGGQSSISRLQSILENQVRVLCCTPTYAIRLGEVAQVEGIALSNADVEIIIVAGEPGGSIPAVYSRIEELWPGAKVCDHHGMTEIGPVSYEDPHQRGVLRLIGTAYLSEIIDPVSGQHVAPGEPGELVITNLYRWGSPLIRYRTGDLVKEKVEDITTPENPEFALDGGILGRVDDMITVRGVNVYPGAIEEILRRFVDIAEYRVEVRSNRAMEEMQIYIEPAAGVTNPSSLVEQTQKAFQAALSLRVPVTAVEPGTLPRFEMKAKRWLKV